MTYEDYSKTKWKFPYSYIVKKEGQHVYYFGAMHTFDPTHYQYPMLRDFFNEFLIKTKGQKKVIFIEGGIPSNVRSSEEESIISGCEAQLMDYLGKNNDIAVISPGLLPDIFIQNLLKEYHLDEIAYYFFARTCLQWNRIDTSNRDFDSYINRALEKDMGDFAHKYLYPHSIMPNFHKQIFNVALDIHDKAFFLSVCDPRNRDTVVGKINAHLSKMRDLVILEEIERYWNLGFNIFITYGGTHAVMQEPAIRSLI